MGALSTAGMLFLGASAVGAVGSIEEGRAANRQSRFEANVLNQQADRELQVSKEEERDFRKNQSAVFAQRRAELGGSGVELSTGTPLLAASDFAAESELQALRIREGGRIRAQRTRQEAKLTRQAGRNAQRRGVFRAGSSLLSGAGTAFNVS